jgi:hypothetical protein
MSKDNCNLKIKQPILKIGTMDLSTCDSRGQMAFLPVGKKQTELNAVPVPTCSSVQFETYLESVTSRKVKTFDTIKETVYELTKTGSLKLSCTTLDKITSIVGYVYGQRNPNKSIFISDERVSNLTIAEAVAKFEKDVTKAPLYEFIIATVLEANNCLENYLDYVLITETKSVRIADESSLVSAFDKARTHTQMVVLQQALQAVTFQKRMSVAQISQSIQAAVLVAQRSLYPFEPTTTIKGVLALLSVYATQRLDVLGPEFAVFANDETLRMMAKNANIHKIAMERDRVDEAKIMDVAQHRATLDAVKGFFKVISDAIKPISAYKDGFTTSAATTVIGSPIAIVANATLVPNSMMVHIDPTMCGGAYYTDRITDTRMTHINKIRKTAAADKALRKFKDILADVVDIANEKNAKGKLGEFKEGGLFVLGVFDPFLMALSYNPVVSFDPNTREYIFNVSNVFTCGVPTHLNDVYTDDPTLATLTHISSKDYDDCKVTVREVDFLSAHTAANDKIYTTTIPFTTMKQQVVGDIKLRAKTYQYSIPLADVFTCNKDTRYFRADNWESFDFELNVIELLETVVKEVGLEKELMSQIKSAESDIVIALTNTLLQNNFRSELNVVMARVANYIQAAADPADVSLMKRLDKRIATQILVRGLR